MIAVDLTGTFHFLQAALPDMLAGQWGRIVTIASSSGQIGSPRQAHYAAAKGGVIAMTKTIAREYAKYEITANTIPPFCVDTPMLRDAQAKGAAPSAEEMCSVIPSGRLGTLDDIGATSAFLCSDVASYITAHSRQRRSLLSIEGIRGPRPPSRSGRTSSAWTGCRP